MLRAVGPVEAEEEQVGYVGGDTAAVGAVASVLEGESGRVASIATVVGSATAVAAATAGDDAASAVLERCGRVWADAVDRAGAQVEALGRVAALAAGDLARAGGS